MKTLRNSSIITLAVVALSLLVAAPVAYATTIPVYGTPDSSTQTVVSMSPIMETISVAQFNNVTGPYAGDTLNSVEVIMSGLGNTDYIASYSGTGTGEIDTFNTTAHLYLNGVNISNLTLALSGTDDMSLTPVYLTVTVDPTTSTYNTGLQPIIGSAVSTYAPSTTGWSGTGDVLFDLTGKANSGYSGYIPSGGALTLAPTSYGGASVEVIYDYSTPGPPVVPEPGTLSLFGTGLLGLAGLLRFKLKAR